MSDQRAEMDQADRPLAAGPSTRLDLDSTVWRFLPFLFLLAVWAPAIASALAEMAAPGYRAPELAEGGSLQQGLLAWFGPAGPLLAAPVIAGVTAAGVWMLARGLGAPRWAGAAVSTVSLLLPLAHLSPDPVELPDDAAFGAAMVVVMACTVRAVHDLSPKALAIAFVVSIIAAWLRPWAVWPALAVLLGVVLVTRLFEERPWCGAIAALCWGPGIFLARLFGETNGFRGGLFSEASDPAGRFGAGVAATLEASREPISLLGQAAAILGFAIPLIILLALAGFAIALLLVMGQPKRNAASCAMIVLAVAVLGAIGYGDGQAARLLLDPMLLGLTGVAGLALPELIRRIRPTNRA
jgi:hypothetical protein